MARKKTETLEDWKTRFRNYNRVYSARPENRKKKALRDKAYASKNKEKLKNVQLKIKFGITLEQFGEMLLRQNSRCAICNTDTPKGRGTFHVDHDHNSRKIRGLLCSNCNTGLGMFFESISLLDKAAQYLNSGASYTPTQKTLNINLNSNDINRNKDLKRHYGLTIIDYDTMLQSQGLGCGICASKEAGGVGRFHVDHEHSTKRIRGLLCHYCNLGLGRFKDSATVILLAIAYLNKYQNTISGVKESEITEPPDSGLATLTTETVPSVGAI